MNRKCATSSNKPRRRGRGLTIVEVLGALVLLATLLVSLLAAQRRFTLQAARAQRRLAAAAFADQLLGQWWLDRGQFPESSSGTVARLGTPIMPRTAGIPADPSTPAGIPGRPVASGGASVINTPVPVAQDGLSWRTTVLPRAELQALGLEVVRLEILDSTIQGAGEGEPLVRVEVVLNDPKGTAQESHGH